MSAPEALLAVQDRDTELDQLTHRRAALSQRAALATARGDLATVQAEATARADERATVERQRVTLDAEVTDLDRRLTDLDRRLRSGEVTATRELTAMVDQGEALRRRQSELEDAELELLMAEEPLDAELARLEGLRGVLEAQIATLQTELDDQVRDLDTEIAAVAEARQVAAKDVPETLLEVYERLRSRLGGTGAARLVGASCGGCHLTLPATELDRSRPTR